MEGGAGGRGAPRATEPVAGVLALTAAVVIWGSTYVVIKGVLDDIGPLTLAVARFGLVLPLMVPFAVARGFGFAHLRLRRFWVFGATGVALYFGLQNLGIAFTTAGSAALITAAIPGLTAVMAFALLGERPARRRWIGIGLSTVGVGLIVGSGLELGSWRAVLGNLLVLASTVAWAAYTVQGRRLGAVYPAIVSTTGGFVAGTLLLLPAAAVETAALGWPRVTWAVVGAVVYLGILASGVAIALWNFGVSRMEASAAGVFTNVVPVVGLLFAVALGEPVAWLQLAGGGVAAAGIVLVQRRRRPGDVRRLTVPR